MTKIFLLITILSLHLTTAWQQLPVYAQTTLARTATPAALVITPVSPAALPVQTSTEPLNPGATSALAIDAATSTVLYSHNADARRPIASLTKLVTALVILARHPLNQTVAIPKLPAYDPADETMGLRPGEIYAQRDLLTAMLVGSEDDAADALALADAGSITKFAAVMNAKMAEWGVEDSHFSNPSGLTDTGNYATATALAKIAQLVLTSPFIRQTINEQSATVTSHAGRVISITTTNELLASNQFYGIKTGYTPAAGECFVGLTRINGHEVITIVLDAGDRFGATTTLTNWIGHNWQWF